MTSQIRAAVLNNYVEVAQHQGLNPQRLLSQVGLSTAMLAQPESRIPSAAVIALLENSAAAANCPTFGLRMAESRQLADFGAVSLLLLHQQTLRDALRVTMNYRHLLNEALVMHIEDAGNMVIIREEVISDSVVLPRQSIEFAIGVTYRLCSALMGAHWHPHSVGFAHAAPPDLQLHRRMFKCNIEFGTEFNRIICPAADLDFPNPHADPAMARYAEGFVASLPGSAQTTTAQEVSQAIYLLLPMGRASIEQVAQTLGVNARTLQRRLQDCDATFSDLISEVRRNLVLRYMENPNYSLSDIADMLGYSVASSFTRWFSAQFGMAPALWRENHMPNRISDK